MTQFRRIRALKLNTVAVSSANVGMACSVAPNVDPGPEFTWSCFIPSSDTVQVRLCNVTLSAATPVAAVYNVVRDTLDATSADCSRGFKPRG